MARRYVLRAGRVEWREVDGEILGLDLPESEYLAVNESGTLLWRRLVAGATHDELVACLRSHYGIEEDSAYREVGSFLDQLKARGLLDADP